jgi:hypothetical protein
MNGFFALFYKYSSVVHCLKWIRAYESFFRKLLFKRGIIHFKRLRGSRQSELERSICCICSQIAWLSYVKCCCSNRCVCVFHSREVFDLHLYRTDGCFSFVIVIFPRNQFSIGIHWKKLMIELQKLSWLLRNFQIKQPFHVYAQVFWTFLLIRIGIILYIL